MSRPDPLAWDAPAWAIAAAAQAGEVSAHEVTAACLARIDRVNPLVNAFTDVTAGRALARAAALDAARAAGADLGPLAGVPFAAKNLFDIQGLPTRAGSRINRGRPPATADAVLIARAEAAGAVLTGGLNMGEYAYDFTGENAHDGACRNPVDPGRMSGGSSSGSGGATAAGLAPVSLGSDTNGSIRVPASLCGLFGLKPTYGRLSRAGTFPFCDSLDHLGPLARGTRDLALAYDALQGAAAGDHACAGRVEPALPRLADRPLRVAVLGGYFARGLSPEAAAAVSTVALALGARDTVEAPGAAIGRAAAYLITNAESSAFHLDRLRTRADDFDPDTRDRFLAGALLPAAWVVRAQAARRWWAAQMAALLADWDLLIAPATPVTAPLLGQRTLQIDGQTVALRPNLGLYTQPISCIGLPVAAVPLPTQSGLPIGVQLIAAPWCEHRCLAAAWALEQAGVARAALPHPDLGLMPRK